MLERKAPNTLLLQLLIQILLHFAVLALERDNKTAVSNGGHSALPVLTIHDGPFPLSDLHAKIGRMEKEHKNFSVVLRKDLSDIDALKLVAAGVNSMRGPERAMVVVTHYQRLLSEIVPDFVHVLAEGRIVKSGGKELALELEAGGYAALGIRDEAEAVARV